MKYQSALLFCVFATTLCLTKADVKNVQKRLFLDTALDVTVDKLREFLRDVYDPRPYEPAMLNDAKRVRAGIGHTLANVTNAQLNGIVLALDPVILDNDVTPALSTLIAGVRQELGDKATYLTDTEIGNVIYEILRLTKPEQEVIDFVKLLVVGGPILSGLGG